MLHYLLENILNSQFPDSHKLNHLIIVASFVNKGSKTPANAGVLSFLDSGGFMNLRNAETLFCLHPLF
jgi:hypothetical protein